MRSTVTHLLITPSPNHPIRLPPSSFALVFLDVVTVHPLVLAGPVTSFKVNVLLSLFRHQPGPPGYFLLRRFRRFRLRQKAFHFFSRYHRSILVLLQRRDRFDGAGAQKLRPQLVDERG